MGPQRFSLRKLLSKLRLNSPRLIFNGAAVQRCAGEMRKKFFLVLGRTLDSNPVPPLDSILVSGHRVLAQQEASPRAIFSPRCRAVEAQENKFLVLG